MKITAFAFAKVNLFLKVIGKRNDGLHNLDMVMQSVSLADKVTVTTDETKGLTVICDGAKIEDNIAEKAALKYFEKAEMAIPNIKFDIEKHIPISGGLAGGSADAAAVLVLCNQIYGKLSETDLIELGGTIGSDVPFCMVGGCARVFGFGDEINAVNSKSKYTMVLVKAGQKRSTGHMYSLIDSRDEHINADANALVYNLENNSNAFCEHIANDFTALWDDEVSKEVCDTLYKEGASAVSLSGSGPTFFGIFFDEDKAKNCYDTLKARYDDTYICTPETAGIKIID